MTDTATATNVWEPERGVHVATIELVFDESAVRARNASPIEVVKRDAKEVFRSLAASLSLALEVQVSITDIEISQGTIKARGRIIAFIIPIIQAAMGGAAGNMMTQPSDQHSRQRYEQVCNTVRTTSETQTQELFAKKGYLPKTSIVTTVTYEEFCRTIQRR